MADVVQGVGSYGPPGLAERLAGLDACGGDILAKMQAGAGPRADCGGQGLALGRCREARARPGEVRPRFLPGH